VNLRIIATSSRDIAAEVHAQQFRADLYYRLNVGRIVFLSWQAVASHVRRSDKPFVPREPFAIGAAQPAQMTCCTASHHGGLCSMGKRH
jgi:transcriptional regulator of aromatic amino acid metabolism